MLRKIELVLFRINGAIRLSQSSHDNLKESVIEEDKKTSASHSECKIQG